MAKYIGTLTSDARGRVGGVVMTRARNGTNLKAHAVGVNTRSGFQLSLRQNFASALAMWRGFAGSDQTTWSLLAAQYTYVNTLAQPYSPTGLQLWTQAFMNAVLSGTLPPTTAPTAPPFIEQIVDATLTVVGSNFVIHAFATGGAGYGGSYTVSLSSVISASLNYTTHIRRRPMGFVAVGPALNISTRWHTAYGKLPGADALISARLVPYDPVSFISATPALKNIFVT